MLDYQRTKIMKGRRLIMMDDHTILDLETKEVLKRTKDDFIALLIDTGFLWMTPRTLFFRDERDIIYVHIEEPQKQVWSEWQNDYIDNPFLDLHKVSVFSEGEGVTPRSELISVNCDEEWEYALQEVLNRF